MLKPLYLSYTSLSDFLKCPNSYYLKNIYRNPKNGFRLQIINPYLTLGSTVHDALKWYLEADFKPSKEQTLNKFRNFWLKYRGERGGFTSLEEEITFGKRGLKMLENFLDNADILEPSAPFIQFPNLNLFEDVVLLGNFDFVGECRDGSLHIVDFKTGSADAENATQLYIYALLAQKSFKKKVSKISFWYLDRDNGPKEVVLDPLDGQLEWLKQKAIDLKKTVNEAIWICFKNPEVCKDCRDYKKVIDGRAKFLFSDYRYRKDIYFLSNED